MWILREKADDGMNWKLGTDIYAPTDTVYEIDT